MTESRGARPLFCALLALLTLDESAAFTGAAPGCLGVTARSLGACARIQARRGVAGRVSGLGLRMSTPEGPGGSGGPGGGDTEGGPDVSLDALMDKAAGKSSAPGGAPKAKKAAAATQKEKVDLVTYVFGKPGELERDLNRMGSSRRRFTTINLAALAFALAANFLGTTSFLLSLLPGLDGLYLLPAEFTQFYPVKGWKRYKGEGAFEFRYPVEWLQDQAIVLANQRGQEDAAMQTIRKGKRKAPGTIPSVAFGPRGGDGKENVSVVRSTLRKGFTLGMLGEPTEAAQKLLNNAIAPKGSGKEATLLEATKELRGEAEVYQFEYTVKLPTGVVLHNVCACVVRDETLYTLTVLAPEELWPENAERLRQVASSFRLV